MTLILTLSEKTLHLLTRLIVIDADVEAKALETFEQLTSVSVRAVTYIHPCRDTVLRIHAFHVTKLSTIKRKKRC